MTIQITESRTPEWEDYRSDPYKAFIHIEDPAGVWAMQLLK